MRILALAAALALAGCGAEAAAPIAAAVSWRPDPPVALKPATICVRPTSSAAEPTAAVLRMPGMPPALTVTLAPSGQGDYCGSVIFVMAGRWAATLQGTGPLGGTLTVEVRN